jgi:hypothetical protein
MGASCSAGSNRKYLDMNSTGPTPTFTETQHGYASLIKRLGATTLPWGETLAEALTVDEVPFWEIFSTELAYRHLTTAVASVGPLARVKQGLRPYLLRLKHGIKAARARRTADGCSSWPAGKTVLCLGFTERMYRDVLEPVVERVITRNAFSAVVLVESAQSAKRSPSADACFYQTASQHWNVHTEDRLRHLKHALAHVERRFESSKALAGLQAGLDPSLSSALEQLFHLLFKGYIPLMAPQAVLARHILEKHRPAIVLSPDTADSRARVYTLLCGKLGIPCLDVQFGLTGDEAIEWRFFAASRVAVWGDSSKGFLTKHGVAEEKIHVTGSPRHDSLVNPPAAVLDSFRTTFGQTGTRKIVVMASTYTDSAHGDYTDPGILREMKLAIFRAADCSPGLLLIVKPHPHENVDETLALCGSCQNVVFAEQTSDIRAVIAACDAFISFGSTATIDALIADKLAVCPIFPGWPFSEVFRDSGAVLVPQSAGELMALFKKLESGDLLKEKAALDGARSAYLHEISHHPDGQASARIEKLVLEMAGTEK